MSSPEYSLEDLHHHLLILVVLACPAYSSILHSICGSAAMLPKVEPSKGRLGKEDAGLE